jgi:hypothetical protein
MVQNEFLNALYFYWLRASRSCGVVGNGIIGADSYMQLFCFCHQFSISSIIRAKTA